MCVLRIPMLKIVEFKDKLCKQIKTHFRQVMILFIIKRHEINLVNGCLHLKNRKNVFMVRMEEKFYQIV